jgi:ABC-type spermidine/putrescine transport system permease subunit II
MVCWYALRSIPNEVLEAAALEGAGSWTRFWHLAVPQRKSALAAAWLAAFVVSVGDLPATILTVPPGVTTIPIRVFGLLHAGVDDQAAGICLNMTLGVLLVVVVAIRLLGGHHVERAAIPPRDDATARGGHNPAGQVG